MRKNREIFNFQKKIGHKKFKLKRKNLKMMNQDLQNSTNMKLPPDLEMPKGHENYSLSDKEKCPYFQISEKTKDIPDNSFPNNLFLNNNKIFK